MVRMASISLRGLHWSGAGAAAVAVIILRGGTTDQPHERWRSKVVLAKSSGTVLDTKRSSPATRGRSCLSVNNPGSTGSVLAMRTTVSC